MSSENERDEELADYLSAVDTLRKVESGEMSVRSFEEWEQDYDRRHRATGERDKPSNFSEE